MNFPLRFLGYDRRQVDSYLEVQVRLVETLSAKNKHLEEHSRRLEEQNAVMSSREAAVAGAMIEAQQAAARQLAAARAEADRVVAEAAWLEKRLADVRAETVRFAEGILQNLRAAPPAEDVSDHPLGA